MSDTPDSDLYVYNQGQARHLFNYLPHGGPVDWFILGGPSCGDEAQVLCAYYPGCKVIAFEPHPRMIEWQRSHGFPVSGIIVQKALSDREGLANFYNVPGPAGGSMMKRDRCATFLVETTTLDSAEKEYGPFTNSVVWLDIEDSELVALRGGKNLVFSGRVLLFNIEVSLMSPEVTDEIGRMLDSAGYRHIDTWNTQGGPYRDQVWIKK